MAENLNLSIHLDLLPSVLKHNHFCLLALFIWHFPSPSFACLLPGVPWDSRGWHGVLALGDGDTWGWSCLCPHWPLSFGLSHVLCPPNSPCWYLQLHYSLYRAIPHTLLFLCPSCEPLPSEAYLCVLFQGKWQLQRLFCATWACLGLCGIALRSANPDTTLSIANSLPWVKLDLGLL